MIAPFFKFHIIIYSGRIGRIIYRAVGLDECFASEDVLVFVILAHGQVEVAVDALVLLKVQAGPLSFVDKSLQGLLQVFEHGVVRARNLSMVDGNLCLQLLCCERITTDEPTRQ